MEKIYDFSAVQGNDIPYGGNAGLKKGFLWENENWFLKFPKSTRGFRNMEISYTTSPLSEYIGSQIYEIIGIPVHDTKLGVYENKAVVACKDFLKPGERLYEFRELKNIYSGELEEYEQQSVSSGSNTDLNSVLKILETNPVLKNLPEVIERFWDMFIVDALIGNNDRNNGNWGLIYKLNGQKELSPVYDNGNCFRNKASDRQLRKTMGNEEAVINSAYKAMHSVYMSSDGRMINPFEYIEKSENISCNEAVQRIVPRIDLEAISEMINRIPETFNDVRIISPVQKEYYSLMLQRRYEDVLLPTFQKLQNLEKITSMEEVIEKSIADPMKECMKRTASKRLESVKSIEREQ